MSEGTTEALFQLIVVGSSAGGIEALSQLVSSLPTPFPVPIVIAQHLDPNRPSHLAKILSRQSQLPIVIVEQHEKLHPGTVYVVPSNKHVAINDHEVSVLNNGQGRPKPSVDLLLSSASQIYGEKLIAVILTGTGSDGKLGVRAVHDNGGTVLAQNPATSAYPGMAQSLDPDNVDIVADLPQIGPLLFDLVKGKSVPDQPNTDSELETFLEQLRAYSGIDFQTYKPGTILRRLQRRIVATNCSNLESYKVYLQDHSEEYDQLISSFLIKVTEFMRDPELFTWLQEQILPRLIEHSRSNNNELRLWSAGCATGQEAYSLAILVCEVLGDKIKDFNIKIFATDVDVNAIAFARRGLYPARSLDKLPKELVKRYFTPERDGYSIKKRVRELVVFGEHDLGQRAPFPKIDMVLCRNVLIYFNRELQQHALELFAFALRDEGYLVLGRSETTGPLAELFALEEEAGQHVYQRQGQRRLTQPLALKNNRPLTSSRGTGLQRRQSDDRSLFQMQREVQQNRAAKDNLLLKLPIGVVIVDDHFDIQEINHAARRLLSIYTVAIDQDLVHLAQYLPARELGSAITKAIQENIVTTLERVEVPHLTSNEPTFLQISCYPHPAEAIGEENVANRSYSLILIDDITARIKTQNQLEQADLQQIQQAADLAQNVAAFESSNTTLAQRNLELQQSNVELTASKNQVEEVAQRNAQQITALVAANQSLLEANEELTLINANLRTNCDEYLMHVEEAQAAIEESDTLNEEMQATNEELETLNEELQATIEELNTTNADLLVQTEELRQRTEELKAQEQQTDKQRAQLEAILISMTDALVVVNSKGEVLLNNAAYRQSFETVPDQILITASGDRPLQQAELPLSLAAKGEAFSMAFSFKLPDNSLRWWEALGQPINNNGLTNDNTVVVLRDITERSLRQLEGQFSSMVIHEIRTPVTVMSGYIQLMAGWLTKQGEKDEKPHNYIRQVLLQMERLERLINDMLDFSRLQSGKFNMDFSPVRLDSLLEQAVEVGQMLTSQQLIELEQSGEPLLIKADAQRILQVIFNLISNARTHAPQSPKIVLRLRRLDDNQAEIKVQDYGPGIKAEYLANIFSRFYQVSRTDEKFSKGLGLGLFISQEIVVAHGGTIRVESTEGIGTTFIINLPLSA